MNYAERVTQTVMACMYSDEDVEALHGEPPEDAIIVEGLTANFGFKPENVRANTDAINKLIDEIVPEDFYKGMSFLNLPLDKNGELWGEHQQAEALYAMAKAVGRAEFVLPREMWGAFPGGMPYILFFKEPRPKHTEAK
jgi:hypothetical protein